MQKTQHTLNLQELDTLALCAFRYALGRATYIVSEVCDLLESLPLSPRTVSLVVRDVEEAKRRDDFARELGRVTLLPLGMDCDRDRWLDFQARMRDRAVAASHLQPNI